MPDTQNQKISQFTFEQVEQRLQTIKFDQGADHFLNGEGNYVPVTGGGTTYDDTDIKNSIGTLTDLATVEQNSLVGAINELDADKADKTDLDAYTKTDDMNLLLAEKADKTDLVGKATETFVIEKINEAQLAGGGQDIDLSIYQTKDQIGELTGLTTTEQDTIVGAINEVKTLADGKADTTELEAHTQDLDIHVTADEKLAWNDKQEKITGTKGQYIGFDDAGEAVAVELELNRNPYGLVDGWLPEGSVVDFREKEIRIMCPATTQWVKSGGGDADKCYIGVKAYAPNDTVMKFKEDWGHPIVDQTMWELTDEDAGTGVDPDGRRYSVFWIPAATLNVDGVTWDYTGKDSAEGDFKGRDYAVEWYTADDKLVASDHIRINFSNENCHASVLPFYSGELGGGGATQTIEDAVIEGSDNPVKSDALYKEFAKKKDADVVVNCMCASTGFSGLTFTSKDKTFTEINDLIVTEKKTVVVELTDTTTTSKYILYYRGANNRLDGGIFTNTNSHDFYGSAKIDGVEKTIILKVNSDDSAVLELSANRYVQLFVDCASGGGTFGLMGNLDKTFEEISKEFHAKNIVEVIAWDNTTMTSCLLSIAYVGADLIKFTGIGDFDGVTKRIVLTIDNQNNQNLEAVDIGGATIEFDDEPLQGSENAVKSGGVFTSIESVKTYSDEKLEEANTYSDNILSDAKIYSDEKLVEAKTYSDQKLTEANQYTDTAVANLVDSAPETMNTLKEVAEAFEQNETVVEALTQAIGNKQDKITGTQGQIVGIGTDGNTTVIDGKLIDTLEYTPSSADGGNNVLKINLTNGTSQSFNIKNGSKGSTGANGTNGTTPTIKVAAGSNINTVGTPSVTASTSGTTTTFTFNNLKGATGAQGATGATGATPTIKVAAGSNINKVGTPSVTASTSGTTTTFTFNYLKGATGATGAAGKGVTTGSVSCSSSTSSSSYKIPICRLGSATGYLVTKNGSVVSSEVLYFNNVTAGLPTTDYSNDKNTGYPAWVCISSNTNGTVSYLLY